MLLKIFKNRTVSSSGTWGTKNENNYEILNFEFPEELEEYNKRIVYYLGNQKVWDAIIDNKAILTNAITTKGSVKAYIWCTKSDEAFETDVDFRTQIFVMNFFENENADGIVPTEEQVDGFNTMLTAMNAKIDEVDALEQTIETAEAERQEAEATRVSNENTRESNESTRQTNEQTRQTQEADRERRTDEAIADIEDKTADYNANAEAKTNEFNDLVDAQKVSIENYGNTQLNAIGKKGQQALGSITTTTQYALQNISAAQQTGVSAVETASSEATTNFNTNATSKTNAFNNNASAKTSEFNTNAESKTTDFNTNATSKTNDFNDNATEKTTAFNENAQDKIDEYDEHIVEYQAQIDELQEEVDELSENMPWTETEQATEISVDDAAKYSKNKLELFGNTEQTQYTGKNLFNVSNSSAYWQTLGFRLIDNIIKISIGDGNGGLSQGVQGEYTNYNFDTNKSYCFSITPKSGDLIFKESASYKWLQVTIYIKYSDDTTSTKHVRITHGMNMSSALVTFTADKTPVAFAIGRYSPVGSLQTNQEAEYYVQLEEGTEATNYEPYVGGQPSPSPDYPQPIHVVTGENTIEVQGKNLFDKNVERKNGFSTGNIGQVVGYGNSSATYSYVNCAKVKANKTYTLSWKIDGTKGATSNRNSKIVDSNNIVLEEFTTWINNTTHITFTPQNTGYLVLTTDISSVDIQLQQGSTVTDYTPYYHADYPIDLGNIELCKIGNYQDYLYKENGNWYKYGAIQKIIFDGTEPWTNQFGESLFGKNLPLKKKDINSLSYNNYYKLHNIQYGLDAGLLHGEFTIQVGAQNSTLYIKNITYTTSTDFKTWLSTHNVSLYYPLLEATSTQITDETLISQLDEIYEHLKLVKGTNNITVTAEDIAPYMELTYMQDLPSKLDNLDSRLALLE